MVTHEDIEPRDAELRAIEASDEESLLPKDHSERDSFLIVSVYFFSGVVWFAMVHMLTFGRGGVMGLYGGFLFLVLSGIAGYILGVVYLGRLYRSQVDFAEAQRSLRQRDMQIRQAYVDVLDAVTGGKLILMTPSEAKRVLGRAVLPATSVTSAEDLRAARARLVETLKPLTPAVDDIQLAVSEALTNVLKHADAGWYWVAQLKDCLQVVIEDRGPGIDFQDLPKATLVPGFSTKQSLGMGFTIMLGLADRVLLATEPGRTLVVLEFDASEEARETGLRDEEACVP